MVLQELPVLVVEIVSGITDTAGYAEVYILFITKGKVWPCAHADSKVRDINLLIVAQETSLAWAK